jgi:hypothetical protein
MPPSKTKAFFVEPLLLLRREMLPEGADWQYKIKSDGYRALAGAPLHFYVFDLLILLDAT